MNRRNTIPASADDRGRQIARVEGTHGSTVGKQSSTPSPSGTRAVIQTPTVLRFKIDRLVLEGVSRGDEVRVVESIEKELYRLANDARGADWTAARRVARFDGGSLPADARPTEIGRHLAQQILRSLQR